MGGKPGKGLRGRSEQGIQGRDGAHTNILYGAEIGRRIFPALRELKIGFVAVAQGNDIVPIPGTKRRKYLEENAAAADLQLSRDDLLEIEEAIPHGAVAGERYPEEAMRMVNL